MAMHRSPQRVVLVLFIFAELSGPCGVLAERPDMRTEDVADQTVTEQQQLPEGRAKLRKWATGKQVSRSVFEKALPYKSHDMTQAAKIAWNDIGEEKWTQAGTTGFVFYAKRHPKDEQNPNAMKWTRNYVDQWVLALINKAFKYMNEQIGHGLVDESEVYADTTLAEAFEEVILVNVYKWVTEKVNSVLESDLDQEIKDFSEYLEEQVMECLDDRRKSLSLPPKFIAWPDFGEHDEAD